MEPTAFDRIARQFAGTRTRRSAMKGGALGLAAFGVGGARLASAQDATPAATPSGVAVTSGEYLFVQTAASGTFVTNPEVGIATGPDGTPTAGGGADYLLTLNGHPGGTVYFSDRPERVFGNAPTQQFLDGLGFSPDNPPNAAIVAQTVNGEDVLVVELVSPAFDEVAGTLTYGANVLPGDQPVSGLAFAAAKQEDGTIAAEFTHASLFIDDCADRDVKCASNKKGVPGNWRGDLGVYNMCFHVSQMACVPCGEWGYGRTDADCSARFPDQCLVEGASNPNQCVTFGVS